MRYLVAQIIMLCAIGLVCIPLSAGEIDLSYAEKRPMPNYPRQAAMDCVEGEVLAQFTVSVSLGAEDVQILRATPSGVFDQVVLDALARWSIDAKPGTELEKLFKFDLGKGACSQ